MVRLTDSDALQILLLLGVFKTRAPREYTLQSAGQDFTDALRENTTEAREGFNEATTTLFQDAIYRSVKDGWIDTKVVEVVNKLATSVFESINKINKDRNLIDELAEALRLPLPENRLNTANVERLQKLILTPSELKEAAKALDAGLRCNNCGCELQSGEMAVARAWDRGSRDVLVFACSRCHTPSYVRCSAHGCGRFVEATKARIGKANYCPNHASPKSIHEPSEKTVAASRERSQRELEEAVALREARDRAVRVRFVVDPAAPPQRGRGANFRTRTFAPAPGGAAPDGGVANTALAQTLYNITRRGILDEYTPIPTTPAPPYAVDIEAEDDDGGL